MGSKNVVPIGDRFFCLTPVGALLSVRTIIPEDRPKCEGLHISDNLECEDRWSKKWGPLSVKKRYTFHLMQVEIRVLTPLL